MYVEVHAFYPWLWTSYKTIPIAIFPFEILVTQGPVYSKLFIPGTNVIKNIAPLSCDYRIAT